MAKPPGHKENVAPSVSPFVSASVRSTVVSPINSGSLRSSAQHVTFIVFPPLILLSFDRARWLVSSLGGGGGGLPAPAVRASSSSISSNNSNRISSSHSGCWPPRLTALVRLVSLASLRTQ